MPTIHLRPIEMNDLDLLMEWVNDPEVVGNFNDLGKIITREEEQKYLQRIVASDKDQLYAIETADGNYVGNIGLHDIDQVRKSARFGLIIGKKQYWGQGYAQSAIQALLEVAFQQQRLQIVWGKFLTTNEKMRHINVNKCGFKVEGIMPGEYFRDGKYHDMLKVSMNADEYQQMRVRT